MPIVADTYNVVVGADTHAATHTFAAVDGGPGPSRATRRSRRRRQLTELVRGHAPVLPARPGIGVAATVLLACSHPGRSRSDAAMARPAATSPIPASSGNTTRQRLNRGGDRRLNWAITTTALVRWAKTPTPLPTSPSASPAATQSRRSCVHSSAKHPAALSDPCKPSHQPRGLDEHRSIPGYVRTFRVGKDGAMPVR
jgi:hypothetical protein